ncbi:murein biosynthesis integral membrane protein MurJ [Brevibacterium casei]|uniref:Virulence factor MviN n=1 Tax=Brevibacterium casei TaxID=33889 RepID=A0A7T2TG77_9MICO|nr:lipid II flippase MurJ [Brevibacterium casei]QPS33149.1 virulence factor MviN [Brevibacterium casei]
MNRLLRVFASAALLVSIITLITRLVGFLRWLVFSSTVGAGTVGTAYQSANQVPNILFEVVAGGALAGAVIPLLAIPLARADRDTAGRIASALLTWAVSVTLPLTIVLAVFAEPIATLLVDSAGDEQVATASFLLMFSPQLVLYGIGAVLTGVLQAHRKFLWPAFAPLLSSLVVIGSYITYRGVGGTDATWETHIGWLGWGTTAGVAALALPLALPMRSTGLRIRPTWSFPPGVAHRALRLAGAGMAALLAQQGAVLVTLVLSNRSGGTGTFVLFNYINAVYLLPYAVLAIPVVTVMFPTLSTWVGRTKDDDAEAADREAAGVRLRAMTATTSAVIVTIGLLGTVILFSAAGPLESFFTSIDAVGGRDAAPFSAMRTAIMVMALAVPGWSFIAWGSRIFYALERSRHAAAATTTGWILVIVGMVAAIALTEANGSPERTLVAICAGYVLGMSAAAAALLVSIRRVLGPDALRGILRRGLHSLFAAALGSAAGALAAWWLAGLIGTAAVPSVIVGILAALVGCLVFAGILVLDRGYVAEVRGMLASRRQTQGPADPTVPTAPEPGPDHDGPGIPPSTPGAAPQRPGPAPQNEEERP